MFIRLTVALAAGLLLGTAQANQIGDGLVIDCSGSLAIDAVNGLSMRCEGGDLSLHGVDELASLTSDVSIDLFSTGRLALASVTLSAPAISLMGQYIVLDQQTSLNAHGGEVFVNDAASSVIADRLAAGGSVVINNGAGSFQLTTELSPNPSSFLTVAPAMVPEPGVISLFCVGALGFIARSGRTRRY